MKPSSLDRRNFLGLTGMLLAAGGLRQGGAQPKSRYRKSLKYGMVHGEASLLQKFRLLAGIGFDGVELDSPSDLDRQEVLEACEESGLSIPGVVDSEHWRSSLGDPDAQVRARGRAALEVALRDCKAFGGSTVLLVPGVVNKTRRYQDVYRRSQEEIRAVLPLAAELEVKIALENVWNGFLLSPMEAVRYVDELESEWVGWYLDVGNLVNFGWPEHWVHALGKRILKLDIKEFSRAKRDEQGLWKGFDVEIGEGDCDWPAVLAALDEVGYSGWASAEVGGGGEERLRDIARRMDHVLA